MLLQVSGLDPIRPLIQHHGAPAFQGAIFIPSATAGHTLTTNIRQWMALERLLIALGFPEGANTSANTVAYTVFNNTYWRLGDIVEILGWSGRTLSNKTSLYRRSQHYADMSWPPALDSQECE